MINMATRMKTSIFNTLLLGVISITLASPDVVTIPSPDEVDMDVYDFFNEYNEVDRNTGGALMYHSRGTLAKMINIDKIEGVKKAKCDLEDRNFMMLAFDDVTVAESWEDGSLLVGSADWNCPSEVETGTWVGLFRRIKSTRVKSKTVLEVWTENVSLMDIFQTAHIRYHYTPGLRQNPEVSHRHKRQADPLSPEIPESLAVWVTDINYNAKSGSVLEIMHEESVVFETENPDIPWAAHCDKCKVLMELGYTFELARDGEADTMHYKLCFNGTLTVETNITIQIGTELSKSGFEVLSNTTDVQLDTATLSLYEPDEFIDGIMLNLGATIWYEGKVNIQAGGPFNSSHTIKSMGDFRMCIEITDPDMPPTYEFEYTETSSEAKVNSYDIGGQTTFHGEIYPVVELKPTIQWNYRESVHWVNISEPVIMRFKPIFTHHAIDDHGVVCFESESDMMFEVSNDGLATVHVDVTVFADPRGWWKTDLNANATTYKNALWAEKETVCENCCVVNCFGDMQIPVETTPIEDVVGAPGAGVSQGDLVSLSGGTTVYAGNSEMSGELALRLIKLETFVAAQWNEGRVLRVEKAWESGATLYGEGRAIDVTVSADGGSAADTDPDVLAMVSRLAVCSGFHFSQVDGSKVLIGVRAAPAKSSRRQHIEDSIMSKGGNIDSADCATYSAMFPELSVGGKYPAGATSAEETCGAIAHRISRMEPDAFAILYHYPDSDVSFVDEENGDSWCGAESRLCTTCDPTSDEPFKWCADRVMTTKMGLNLKRLATLLGSGTVTVTDAWHEPTSSTSNAWGDYEAESLHYEGRAAVLTGGAVGALSSAAACAGFDYVEVLDSSSVYVCVRMESSDGGTVVPFQETNLVSVDTPPATDAYDYPMQHEHEPFKTYLFDSHGVEDVMLSEHFSVSDFMYPGKRYFRVDERLVTSIQLAQDNFPLTIKIVEGSAYRTRAENLYNLDTRHPKETYRYQAGQAAEIQVVENNDMEYLLPLAKGLLRTAGRLRYNNLGVGIGIHEDRLYVDIRESPLGDQRVHAEVWKVGNVGDISELEKAAHHLRSGAPEIRSCAEQEICNITTAKMGEGNEHYTFKFGEIRPECNENAETTEFCTDTEAARTKIVLDVKKQYTDRIVIDPGLDEYALIAIEQCLKQCGPCQGDGYVWQFKVENCIIAFNFYLDNVVQLSMRNNMAFFNILTENEELREKACLPGMCITETNGYILFESVALAKYKPDPAEDVENLMYGPGDNPTPLFDVMSQGYANLVSGNVSVWIENQDDFGIMAKVLKVLMVSNVDVDIVFIYFWDMPEITKDIIRETLQRKIEVWAGTACPKKSRAAVAPFRIIETGPDPSRRKRSTMSPGQYIRKRKREWELDWLKKVNGKRLIDEL